MGKAVPLMKGERVSLRDQARNLTTLRSRLGLCRPPIVTKRWCLLPAEITISMLPTAVRVSAAYRVLPCPRELRNSAATAR